MFMHSIEHYVINVLRRISFSLGQRKMFCLSDKRKCCKVFLGLLISFHLSRMDHSLEIQSLKLCQSHPNVVRIHEIHGDEVRTVSIFNCNFMLVFLKLQV